MPKEKITLLFHGFQTTRNYGEHDFDDFVKFAKKKNISNIEKICWYNISSKNELKRKKYEKTIREAIKQHQGKEITLIGYSMGTVVSLAFCSEFEDVKKIILIYPTLYIYLNKWFNFITHNTFVNFKKKRDHFFKKPSIEAKIELENNLNKKTIEEKKYVYRLSFSLAFSVKRWRKKIRNIHDKDITIMWNYHDKINNVKKSKQYLKKHLEKETNEITLIENSALHEKVLAKDKTRTFETLIELMNK